MTYLDWLARHSPKSRMAMLILVAHFFRRAFDLLRSKGRLGLDCDKYDCSRRYTQSRDLRWICAIMAARSITRHDECSGRVQAAVVVSVVHVCKGRHNVAMYCLMAEPFQRITAYLVPCRWRRRSAATASTTNRSSFQGSISYWAWDLRLMTTMIGMQLRSSEMQRIDCSRIRRTASGSSRTLAAKKSIDDPTTCASSLRN